MLLDCGNDKHVEANPFDDSIDVREILRLLFCRKESHEETARASNSFLTILKEALQRFLCRAVKSATHRYPRRPWVDVALQYQQTEDPYWEGHDMTNTREGVSALYPWTRWAFHWKNATPGNEFQKPRIVDR